MCNIYIYITTETKASAKFQDNSDNEHAQWDFYFIFNSKGPRYLRFIILDDDLSNLCHDESGNAYSLPTSRQPRLLSKDPLEMLPLVPRLLRNAKMSTQIIVTRLEKILTFIHTSSSHFLSHLQRLPDELKHISVSEISCYFNNLIDMNDYSMKQRFQTVTFQRSNLKLRMYMLK